MIRSTLLIAAAMLAGCASLPRSRGYEGAAAEVAARTGHAPAWQRSETPPELPSGTLQPDDAVRLALAHSPRVREIGSEIGLSRSEFEEARRLANPRFGFARMGLDGGGVEITRSLSATVASLLMLPTRSRLARGELERTERQVAADLLVLATDVEVAWHEAVSAAQVAAMRDLVARAAETSAALAQRFFDAGNIARLQLEQEQAAAVQARIAALRAHVDALESRAGLAEAMGVPTGADFRLGTALPAPLDGGYDADALTETAFADRLDLAAARQAVALRAEGRGVASRWRWLGDVELGYERESSSDGERKQGPSIDLELPLFDQGQGALARADAELVREQARLDALELKVRDEVRLAAQRVALARDIAERYRATLLPRRESIVERTQENVNFMLQGVFELIAARQDQYDAYQEYLEAVRDYWVARARLRGLAGGRLPDDGAAREATLGVDVVLPPSTTVEEVDHSQHHGGHR